MMKREEALNKILVGVETLTPELCELLEQEYNVNTNRVLEIWMGKHKKPKEDKTTLSQFEAGIAAKKKRIAFLKRTKEGEYAPIDESSLPYARLVQEREEVYEEEYYYGVS